MNMREHGMGNGDNRWEWRAAAHQGAGLLGARYGMTIQGTPPKCRACCFCDTGDRRPQSEHALRRHGRIRPRGGLDVD